MRPGNLRAYGITWIRLPEGKVLVGAFSEETYNQKEKRIRRLFPWHYVEKRQKYCNGKPDGFTCFVIILM